MKIVADGHENLLASWLQQNTFVRVEVVGANVSLSFTGVLARYSTTEIVIARGSDELSISTFFGSCSVTEGPEVADQPGFWDVYRRVVHVTTDGGAQCHLYELRDGKAVS